MKILCYVLQTGTPAVDVRYVHRNSIAQLAKVLEGIQPA